MKTLIAFAFALTAALTATHAQAASFQCTARGYNEHNISQTVRGHMRPERFRARDSALQACRMRGLSRCMIHICHQFGPGRIN